MRWRFGAEGGSLEEDVLAGASRHIRGMQISGEQGGRVSRMKKAGARGNMELSARAMEVQEALLWLARRLVDKDGTLDLGLGAWELRR